MIYVEDLIDTVSYSLVAKNKFHNQIIETFAEKIFIGNALTANQGKLAVKILKSYVVELSEHYNTDISAILANPQFKLAPLLPITESTITLVEHQNIKSIKVSFPFDQAVVNFLKSRNNNKGVQWDRNARAWFLQFTEESINTVASIRNLKNWKIDQEILSLIQQQSEVIKNIEKYAPIITIKDDVLQIINQPAGLPELTAENNLKRLFEARNLGITTWDETVEKFLDNSDINPFTKAFLSSSYNCTHNSEKFIINKKTVEIDNLREIVENCGPVMITCNMNTELEDLKMFHDFLNRIGIINSNIAVLFRKESNTKGGERFNSYIANKTLNNKVHKNTNAIFVGFKFPKFLHMINHSINCVIASSLNQSHYSLQEYVDNFHNVVYYTI
jgi:hypothetical protein